SNAAKKAMRQEMRSWHLQLKSDKTLEDLSKMFDPVLRGWANYYGKFYKSGMARIWQHLNRYLTRWVMRKYKRLARHRRGGSKHLGRGGREKRQFFEHCVRG